MVWVQELADSLVEPFLGVNLSVVLVLKSEYKVYLSVAKVLVTDSEV
jgi:hypothetical protein